MAKECWVCGKPVARPKAQVRENVRSYGSPSGTITSPIHYSCYKKLERDGEAHYLKLEMI